MSTVIDTLKAHDTQAAADAAEQFDVLVQRLAAGEDIEEAQAREILAAAGKSPDDLAAAVARSQRVSELERQLAELDDQVAQAIAARDTIPPKLRRAEERLTKARDTLSELRREHEAAKSAVVGLGGQRAHVQAQLDDLLHGPPPPKTEPARPTGKYGIQAPFSCPGGTEVEPAKPIPAGVCGEREFRSGMVPERRADGSVPLTTVGRCRGAEE